MSDTTTLADNVDDRLLSTYDTEQDYRDNVKLAIEKRADEESDLTSIVREGPMDILPSVFVESAFKIPAKGKLGNFSFKGREYLRVIYDSPAKRKLLIAGRQVEKSTLLGNSCLSYLLINPYFRSLYVSPSNQQTKVFSRDRIAEPVELSPFLTQTTNSRLLKNVFEKKFVNHSQVTLRFAFLNADRTRGVPADQVIIDEFQDILLDNVPVIEECASHSEFKYFVYAGTPKSLDNSIEYYWARFSTQNEWVVPCRRHGTPKDKGSWHWNILDEENIGEHGLICNKCRKPIRADDPDSKWAAVNSATNVKNPFEGYRIPQLMVPWIEWADIKNKQKVYSRAKFHNEVLGRSYDAGTRPLTRRDVKRNCWDELSMRFYREVIRYSGQYPIFMGADWGCHDDKTRILTKRGFVPFEALIDSDLVAQFEQTSRRMSFVKPQVRTVKDWDGELLHFKGRSVDMMLTGTHRMLISNPRKENWRIERAQEVVNRVGGVSFRGSVTWKGARKLTWTLPAVPGSTGFTAISARTFRMDYWLEFLGYYLSEGGLCWAKRKRHLKMSQRGTGHPDQIRKIKRCFKRLGIQYQEYPNLKTGDLNWTICGKQFWNWVLRNVGGLCSAKRIPREFLALSTSQLQILFDAMMLGDGSRDRRARNFKGCYMSTSKGLCEDFQELSIRLGLRATLSLYAPAFDNRKARHRVSWSAGFDRVFNRPSTRVCRVPYKGKVYCCKVPNGLIVTERNGRIAYQGNSGENSYTVVCLGGYLPFAPDRFTWFYWRRFEGAEAEPRVQIEIIRKLIVDFNVQKVGVDYGGGHWPNDELTRDFGADKIKKYQWVGNVKKKIKFDAQLGVPRHLCHRTEVMSDIFNAIKRANVFWFPRWEEFEEPFAMDMLNIFSEFNDRLRMNIYKCAPGRTDDSLHAMTFGFLASFYLKPRADVVLPTKEVQRAQGLVDRSEDEDDIEELDIDR